MNNKLQQEIYKWLEQRMMFADMVTPTELIIQLVFTDWQGGYEGKEADVQEICENCDTVEEACDYVKNTTTLNVYNKSVLSNRTRIGLSYMLSNIVFDIESGGQAWFEGDRMVFHIPKGAKE